jgi:hypothetical protein
VGALSWGANAAPISGSFSLDIVFFPQHGSGDPINKVDKIDVKFEADLILTLSISGLDITSTTVFTFRGLEFQSFVISATVGALTIKDTIIFSPTFFEFEELRDQFGRLRWCVNLSRNPNHNLAGDHANCDFPSFAGAPGVPPPHYFGGLNAHIDDVDFGTVPFHEIFGPSPRHPLVQNLVLARWVDVPPAPGFTTPRLQEVLRFRKKIADLSLNIAGLVLSVKALFANLAAGATAFDLRSGLVLSMEGKTVSGVGVRGELWLGAKQGLECFGECKPLERFFNAKVTGGGFNNVEEEKLFLTNVVIAGVRHDLRAEFHFDLTNRGGGERPNVYQCRTDQVDEDGDGWFGEDPVNFNDDDLDGVTDEDDLTIVSPLCFLSLTQSGVIAPWRLSFSTTWNFGGQLDLLSNLTTLQLKAGEMAVAATFVWWQSANVAFTTGLTNFVTTFDPPGLQVTSNITFCSNPWVCFLKPNVHQPFLLPPVVRHVLSFTGTVGALSVAASARFEGGIFGNFAELDVDMAFSVGAASFTISTVLLVDMLGGFGFNWTSKF